MDRTKKGPQLLQRVTIYELIIPHATSVETAGSNKTKSEG